MERSKKRPVLFYDSHASNRRNAATVFAVAGCEVTVAKNESQFLDLTKTKRYDLYVFPIEYHDIFIKIRSSADKTPRILLSQSKIKDLKKLFGDHISTNILAKGPSGLVNPRDLITTTKKIFHENIFGVEHYLNHGTVSEIYHVRDSKERHEYLDALDDYCKSFHIRTAVRQSVSLFCEELLMNAIYDAPRDEKGVGMYGHKSRRDRILLKPQQAARMEFACDGEKLVVSVSDPFGAITWDVVQKYLARCFSSERKITNLDQDGGAGLGLYMCFTAANSFIINVSPEERSEFIGIFDLQCSPKEKNRLYSSLHFFSTEPSSHIPKLVYKVKNKVG
ncbi:MAG: hypothetical protein HRU19_04790 [Pseudobacteriovorax sp.]|nr:hypothetical protein [Pseudobacteriovorax sp.]